MKTPLNIWKEYVLGWIYSVAMNISTELASQLTTISEEIACNSHDRLRIGNHSVCEMKFGGRRIHEVYRSE